MLKRTAIILVVSAIAAPVFLQAAPLEPREVSAKTKWVAHADVEKALKDKVGAKGLPLLMTTGPRDGNPISALDAYGFNFLRDVKGVTVYGTTPFDPEAPAPPADITVVIHAAFDPAKLLKDAKALPEYKEAEYNGHALCTLCLPSPMAKGRLEIAGPCWVSFGKDVIVVGFSQAAVEAGLDVLDGKAPALKLGTPATDWVGKPAASDTIFAAATGMRIKLPSAGEMNTSDADESGATGGAEAVAEEFHLTLGETVAKDKNDKDAGILRGAASLHVSTAAAAQMLQRQLQKELASFSSEMEREEANLRDRGNDDGEMPAKRQAELQAITNFRRLLGALSISVEKQTVSAKLEIAPAPVVKLLEFLEQELKRDFGP